MELLFSKHTGDYSYCFRGSSDLISITVTVSLSSSRMQLQETIPSGILKIFLQLQLHDELFSNLKRNDFEVNGIAEGFFQVQIRCLLERQHGKHRPNSTIRCNMTTDRLEIFWNQFANSSYRL